MTYFLAISKADKSAQPMTTQNMSIQEEWMLLCLRQGFDITITRPGLQPWHNKTWKHTYERRNLPLS